ncbi:hypothetical protein [Deinococcus maricopensis]|uniref:Uncharacterized protein n=1 Tax=Deinococcus maricopensis (strain DSM 21211 / LMG 22137 / NRRL B-23946 / LB-34) TaxID=709986 RepID=E8U614_DEIML|nr:hypothetical protein [Deinococcus maricopensis]ADV66503.1 hypothetical protein Deima_0848 [Deinococcus maricopensis DSM 21211]
MRRYIPPIRRGGQARPGGTGRLDLIASARDPRPVVQHALRQVGRDPSQVPASVRPGISPRALEIVLLGILPPYQECGRVVPAIPHPTALPLSRAFIAGERAGTLRPVYPSEWGPALHHAIRDRDGQRCVNCGFGFGDLYVHRPWNKRVHAPDPVCIMVHGRMAIAHADSDPGNLVGLRSLCGVCHNTADRVHTRSGKALTLAFHGQLTESRLDYLVQQIILPATLEAERPLGALQPGGADLLTAVLADREMNLTWPAAIEVLPSLAGEDRSDINRVLAVGSYRLQLRGLMSTDYQLTRMLTVPDPEDGSHLAPSFVPRGPSRRHRHAYAAAPTTRRPRPAPRARARVEA